MKPLGVATTHGITTFVQRRTSGWPLAMHVVALGGDELLIHSPTWIDDDTFARIEKLGAPKILFAPNHFHNQSLRRYRERYPTAIVAASNGAIPRLRAQGHDGVRSTEDVALPALMRWLVPEGTKSGEAWLSIDHGRRPTWIVCDAFFNETKPVRGFEGAVLRLGKISPGLCVGATFKLLCIRDRARYTESVLDALSREEPMRIFFSHGDPIETEGAARLAEILRARLG